MTRPVRVGLVAASRIAENAVVGPAREVPGVEVVAVAARDGERARDAAARWGIPAAFASYEAMLASDDIDAVYIGTPASLHRRWTLAALDAGLDVLCEKPFAANAEDARVMAGAAADSDRVVMEAFHWRYHPLVSQMRSVLAALGPLERVEAWFEIADGRIPRSDIRWSVDLGGGATMDLGCYAIQWVRWAIGSEPRVVSAEADATGDGVDSWLQAELAWGDGVTGSIRSSMVAEPPGRGAGLAVIAGGGTMRVDNPIAPQRGSQVVIERDGESETLPVDRSATYVHQLTAFRDAVMHGTPFPTSPADAVRNMQVVDECYRAAGLSPRPTHPD
jgi:predicted dehydrogenase